MSGTLRVACVLAAVLVAGAQVFSASRIVMVVAPTDFTDREYADPRAVFDKAGAAVVVASTSNATAVGHDGMKLRVDVATRDLKLDQLDAIIVVGGAGALSTLMDDADLLARAGVQRNRPATCYPDARVVTTLKMNGAEYTRESVITSDRVVTASGPEAAKEFARRVLDALGKG